MQENTIAAPTAHVSLSKLLEWFYSIYSVTLPPLSRLISIYLTISSGKLAFLGQNSPRVGNSVQETPVYHYRPTLTAGYEGRLSELICAVLLELVACTQEEVVARHRYNTFYCCLTGQRQPRPSRTK